MATPNPVIEAIDAGHYVKYVKGEGGVCRVDAEKYPCDVILDARRRLRERAAHMAVAAAAKKARER